MRSIRPIGLLGFALFVAAVWLGRATAPTPAAARVVAPDPPTAGSILVERGSVEQRLRTQERHLLELRIRVEELESGGGGR